MDGGVYDIAWWRLAAFYVVALAPVAAIFHWVNVGLPQADVMRGHAAAGKGGVA